MKALLQVVAAIVGPVEAATVEYETEIPARVHLFWALGLLLVAAIVAGVYLLV